MKVGKLIPMQVYQFRNIAPDIPIFADVVVINIALGNMPIETDYHWRELAPSPDLFSWYGKQNKNNDSWWDYYEKTFKLERHDAYWAAIERIVDLLLDGKDVYILCFCYYEDKCHRSIVRKDIEDRLAARQ